MCQPYRRQTQRYWVWVAYIYWQWCATQNCHSDTHISAFFLFFCRHYSLWCTLTSFMIAHLWSRYCDFCLQILMPIVFRLSNETIHLIVGLSTRWVPSGLCRVNLLQGFCSCILKKGVPAISTVLLCSLSLYLVHYIIYKIHPYTIFLNWSINSFFQRFWAYFHLSFLRPAFTSIDKYRLGFP
jgi:hypothetical protein